MAVLWIARTGSPWRDLPLFFGNWNSVFKRYRDWVKAGVFIRLFEACSDEPDSWCKAVLVLIPVCWLKSGTIPARWFYQYLF